MDSPNPREPVRFLVFSASLRTDSLNSTLARLAADTIKANGGEVDWATMADFDSPSFNADLEVGGQSTPGALEFRRRLEACDAFVISSPEYNASMPGLLKNAIDWASRFQPQPFHERHGLLLSASPSMVGGNRGLWAVRIPLEHLGARIYPDMFSLAQAHQSFGPDGRLDSDVLQQRFDATIVAFMNLVEASTHYPCVKQAWVEFLGEQPEPVIDHVE
jgi:chromate reductase, NAD(P)H dehydrogenase (quinone)